MASIPVVYVVAAAIIDARDRVLLAQRPPGKAMAGLWELPGGKLEAGESPERALARELKEELDMTVQADVLKPLTFASHAYENFHLVMPVFVCREWTGGPAALEGQVLAWARPDDLFEYPAPEADIPLFSAIQKHVRDGQRT